MRKHDEGYALPFVLVVLLVMCALAVAVMDFSTRNLKAQQATIWRMQDKYAATGEIEKVFTVMHTSRIDPSNPVKFAVSENLRFSITGNVLRVAAFSKQIEAKNGVWVIAAIKTENAIAPETLTEEAFAASYSAGTEYLWYEVVTQETADLFIKPQTEAERYTPWGVS